MIDITSLDTNMTVSGAIPSEIKENFVFYNIDSSPFSIHGVFKENGHYVRMPSAVARTVSKRVYELNDCTAGGRIRFMTDSKRIAIHADCFPALPRVNMPYITVTGFDLYATHSGTEQYFGTFKPPVDCNGVFEDIVELPFQEKTTVSINMPLYNGVKNVYIGIEKGAHLEAAPPLLEPPVVYYGSSITQGGCASRPGCSYEAMLHRHLKTDYINLGFSGNAKAEEEIMHYIACLNMSVFVYDYDHNAPDAEHLQRTHYRGYRIVREANPKLPILLMSKPKYYLNESDLARNKIIRSTYERALAEGDKHIFFIDGRELLLPDAFEYSLIDNVHPNDLGFFGMYTRMKPLIEKLVL